MPKIIKVTEAQLKRINLDEVTKEPSVNLSNGNTKPFDGYSTITADGKLNGEENAKQTTSDKVQKTMTPQGFYRYRIYGDGRRVGTMREGVEVKQQNDTADDIGEVDAIDSEELEDDSLVKIPQIVKERIEQLLDTIESSKLSPKQNSVVINQLIKKLTSSSTAYPMQKKLDKMIKGASPNKIANNQMKQNIANND